MSKLARPQPQRKPDCGGSTEHVLDMRISCFVMVENVRRIYVGLPIGSFVSLAPTFPQSRRESGHSSICQNGLKVLLRVTVRPKKRDSSAISSGV